MREKRMRRVLVWVLLLALVIGQGNMAFAGKPEKPPSSLLDITTVDIVQAIPEDKPFDFYVEAKMSQDFDVVWSFESFDNGSLDFVDSVESSMKTGKTTTYYEKALFRFTPIDDNISRPVSFRIFASDNSVGTINKDQMNVTFNVTAVEVQTNTSPVAVDDQADGIVGTELLIQPLSNDSDPDGDVLSLVSVTMDNGTVIPFVGSEIRITPTAAGTLTLLYVITDGQATDDGIITVSVKDSVKPFVYVALGDSIPAGYSAEKSLPKIIESYTDKIYNYLNSRYLNVEYYDRSISGLNIYHDSETNLFDQVLHDNSVRGNIASADLITLCIGANDIMDAAPESTYGRDFYNINWSIADDGLNKVYAYWDDIINEIYRLNSDVELVVMNMYNPYTITDAKKNNTSHEVYGFNSMHFLVDKYFYSVEDLNPSKNDGIDYGLNYIIENPDLIYDNFSHQYKVVNVYDYFEINDPTKSKLIAFYDNYYLLWGFYPIPIKDPHPTKLGQTKLFDLHAATIGW